MAEDPRNCGTIACIINAEGYCWCGLKWDGQKMSRPPLQKTPEPATTRRKLPKKTAVPSKKPVRKTA